MEETLYFPPMIPYQINEDIELTYLPIQVKLVQKPKKGPVSAPPNNEFFVQYLNNCLVSSSKNPRRAPSPGRHNRIKEIYKIGIRKDEEVYFLMLVHCEVHRNKGVNIQIPREERWRECWMGGQSGTFYRINFLKKLWPTKLTHNDPAGAFKEFFRKYGTVRTWTVDSNRVLTETTNDSPSEFFHYQSEEGSNIPQESTQSENLTQIAQITTQKNIEKPAQRVQGRAQENIQSRDQIQEGRIILERDNPIQEPSNAEWLFRLQNPGKHQNWENLNMGSYVPNKTMKLTKSSVETKPSSVNIVEPNFNKLKADYIELKVDMDELGKNYVELWTHTEKLEKEIEELKKEKEEFYESFNVLKGKNDKLRVDNEDLKEQNQELTVDNEELKKYIAKADENHTLNGMLSFLQFRRSQNSISQNSNNPLKPLMETLETNFASVNFNDIEKFFFDAWKKAEQR